MKEFLISLITLSAICSVAVIVSPDGSFKKYVTLACTLCGICFIVSSVTFSMPDGFRLPQVEITDKTDELRKMQLEQTLLNIENAVISASEEKYGISPEKIKVTVAVDSSDYENMKLSGIYITLSGLENAAAVTRLQTYISNTFGCYTEVTFVEDP